MKSAVFDLECNGLLEELTTIHCAVVLDIDSQEKHLFTPENIDQLCPLLDQYDCLITHNGIAYDFPALRKVYGWEYEGEKWDTLLVSRMQRPNRTLPVMCRNRLAGPHSVEAWAYRIGEDRKLDHEDWSEFSEAMLARCVRDCELQYRIYLALLKEGEGEGWERAHKLNHKLFHYLEKQESYGWLVDREWFEYCCRVLDRYIRGIDYVVTPQLPLVTEIRENKKDGEWGWVRKPFLKSGEHNRAVVEWFGNEPTIKSVSGPFSRISFRPVDLNSNQETKDFLLAQGWEPLEWNTNNAGKRTSPKLSKSDPFEGINSALGKLIAKRVQCRHRRSQIEGWLEAIRPDGRIGAKVGGIASTGRLKHAVIVNVPNSDSFFGKHMRKGFIAQPGWVLVGTDSKGNQMRQLAAMMDDSDFTHAVLNGTKENGDDLHSLNQKRAKLPTRTSAKNFFYGGILFGAGDRKGGKLIGDTPQNFAALKAAYFQEMPKLKALIDREAEAWRQTANRWWDKRSQKWRYENGYITGLDGRPILVEYEKDILVYHLQGMEAVHMAAAYCMAHKRLEKAGYVYGKDYSSCIYYHDEIVFSCREEIAEHVSAISRASIRDAGKFYKLSVEHDGDSRIGRSWFEVH